ncbi:MAG: adenosine deaminase family protein [Planctomycetes bacterium]|nr:adenosine deaminase family protein [Planctomycetota bacterium]
MTATPPEPRPVQLDAMSPRERRELFLALPKTDLHCHLDGSLRVSTVAELAADRGVRALAERLGYRLPSDTSEEHLGKILAPGLGCQSLEEYLLPFDIICGVLQTREALTRAAYELAMDAAAENVWYLEVRFAPQRHIHPELSGIEVIRAVDDGLRKAEEETGGKILTGILICAMRNYHESIGDYHRRVRGMFPYATSRELGSLCSLAAARLAVEAKRAGVSRVLGFDLAGAEANFPPSHHREAFSWCIDNFLDITVHAGEGYGPASIQEAVTHLNAQRIGHGTRILEEGDGLLTYLRDRRVAVEVCLTSNLQTKAIPSLDAHPFRRFLAEEVRAPLCTDNRLVSNITLTDEYELAWRHFGLSPKEIRRTVLYGFKAAFVPYARRRHLLLAAKARLRELGLGGQWTRAEEEAFDAWKRGAAATA